MLINRVGDFGLFVAIVLMLTFFRTCTFMELFPLIINTGEDFLGFNRILLWGTTYINIVTLIAFFIFLGAVGKSAQVGLHV